MCPEIYERDPARFLSAPGLAQQATSKKTKVKLDLLTDIDMLLMAEKSISKIYHTINQYTNANNEYMKNYDENKKIIISKYWDVINLYGWVMSIKIS